MEINNDTIIISQDQKPFYQNVFAAILYTLTLFTLCVSIHYLSIRWIAVGLKCLELASVLLFAALKFSVIRKIYLNTTTSKLTIEYCVKSIKLYSVTISNMNYVSIFKKRTDSPYQINLWYHTNKHFNICTFKKSKEAFEIAQKFANKLNIDLLDATENGNSK